MLDKWFYFHRTSAHYKKPTLYACRFLTISLNHAKIIIHLVENELIRTVFIITFLLTPESILLKKLMERVAQ